MFRFPISRRQLLKGTGGVMIGLPLLEEMAAPARAADADIVPVRSFNVFFGLGIPRPLQGEGFDGVLQPLSPLQDKLLILREVDQIRCDERGINAHFDGASAAFTAEPPAGEARSGGPSIDQVVRHANYPNGLPPDMVPTLVAGTFFRRSRVSRYVHSYNPDGTVAAAMQERPRDLFDRVFGTFAAAEGDAREQRLTRSVLDTVVDQYRYFSGPRSPLGKKSRAKIVAHLERIREYEQRAFAAPQQWELCRPRPPASKLKHGGSADPGGQGIDMRLDDLTTEWRLMADLYAMAIELDRVRFGSITFLAAGERLRIEGAYRHHGRLIYEFNDAKDLNATGDKGCSHEWWHRYNPRAKNVQLRAHAHMKMREVAYFLNKLDEIRDANGRTALENSMVCVSTESGDGRHNDAKRELSGVFHAISGAGNRFKTGQTLDVGHEALDVYNTMVNAMGATTKLGPSDREFTKVDSILA